MKALTISQPYASLIANNEKFIENRTWNTSYRGPLAIHAGKGSQYLTRDELKVYLTGCVIAIAKLTACVSLRLIRERNIKSQESIMFIPGSSYRWCNAAQHRHAEGPFCWILEDVQRIEPIQINGKQGLWEFEYNQKPLETQLELF